MSNRFISLNGTDQFLNIPGKNLLDADNSIVYASIGDVGAVDSAVERVLIADEGIATAGLPPGIKTCIKITMDGVGTGIATVLSLNNLTIIDDNHQFSGYVLEGGSWDGGAVTVTGGGFVSAGFDQTVNVTPNTTTWQRASQRVNPDAGDLAGRVSIFCASIPTNTRVLYVTGVQVVQEDTLSAFDENVILSPGNQDFWAYAVARTPNSVISSVENLVCKFNVTDGSFREWSIFIDEVGDFWSGLCSGDGTGSASAGSVSLTPNQWDGLFLQYDSGINQTGTRVNNGSLDTNNAPPTIFQGPAEFNIGARDPSETHFEGSIGIVMFGCTAGGMTDSLADIAAFLANSGRGLLYSDLTQERIDRIGLIEMWDWQGATPFTGQHSGIVLTDNNLVPVSEELHAPLQGANVYSISSPVRVPARFSTY